MSIIKFLTSKVFLKQIGFALGALLVAVFLLMQWLKFRTNHGQEIKVPDLSGLTISEVEEILDNVDLEYVINDTVDFKKEFPANSVVGQDPSPNSLVKSNRKIYLKLNAATFSKVAIPDYTNKTYRQVLPTLLALGFVEGDVKYEPYFALDVVLEIRSNGKVLKEGDLIPKNSKIDFVLGDGNAAFDDSAEAEQIENVNE